MRALLEWCTHRCGPLWFQERISTFGESPKCGIIYQLAAGNTMSDDSVPPDPWSEPLPKWEPPPLRFPKGLERLRGPDEDDASRLRRKPRAPRKERKDAKLKEEEEADYEEADILTRLRLFARDPSMIPYYDGVGLPGEGEYESLDLLRRCISSAQGD